MPVGEAQHDLDQERRHDDDREDDRAQGDDVEAADVGVGEHGDEGGADQPELPAVQLRPPGGDVALDQGDVDGRVDPLAGPRPPAALEAPELAHGAPRPGVVAALLGQRRAQLGADQRHGHGPEDGQREQHEEGEAGARRGDHVLDAEGARGHEDEDHGNHGEQTDVDGSQLLGHVRSPSIASHRASGLVPRPRGRACARPPIGSDRQFVVRRQIDDAPRRAVLGHELEERRRLDLLGREDARSSARAPWRA